MPSSYRFICYCFLPSVYLVKGKDIKRYLCFQILCSRFYQSFYNSAQLSNNLCEIMQPAAFLCVICGRITCKRTQSIRTDESTMSLADLVDNRWRNNKSHLKYTILKSKHLLAFSTQLCALNFNIAVISRKKVNNVANDECVNICLF